MEPTYIVAGQAQLGEARLPVEADGQRPRRDDERRAGPREQRQPASGASCHYADAVAHSEEEIVLLREPKQRILVWRKSFASFFLQRILSLRCVVERHTPLLWANDTGTAS